MSAAFGALDTLKIKTLLAVRWVNRLSIETWSRTTFRRPTPPVHGTLSFVPAADHYASRLLPPYLRVPEELPADAKLAPGYVAPYYLLAGVFFQALRHVPLSPQVGWHSGLSFEDVFERHPEGWADTLDDDAFTALRTQGPNPFLLRRAADGHFEVDYGPLTEGVFEPVVCRFRATDTGLEPTSITVGEHTTHPGEPGWDEAKLRANGVEARFTVFVQHLLHTHLICGQSFVLSKYTLPAHHPVRAVLDVFTYSTLAVNDYAFKLLVTPASYFLQANFAEPEHVQRLFANYERHFRLEQLIPPKDIAQRGLQDIPNHPYATDALDVWDVLTTTFDEHVRCTHPDDASVAADAHLQTWWRALMTLLPDRDPDTHTLDGVAGLVEILSALAYLQVTHEICGDFSPYVMCDEPTHKRIVAVDTLLDPSVEVRAADVFLFDQGAWAGRFEHNGNLLLDLEPAQVTHDAFLQGTLGRLKDRLLTLDDELLARDTERTWSFLRMRPRTWQASISY